MGRWHWSVRKRHVVRYLTPIPNAIFYKTWAVAAKNGERGFFTTAETTKSNTVPLSYRVLFWPFLHGVVCATVCCLELFTWVVARPFFHIFSIKQDNEGVCITMFFLSNLGDAASPSIIPVDFCKNMCGKNCLKSDESQLPKRTTQKPAPNRWNIFYQKPWGISLSHAFNARNDGTRKTFSETQTFLHVFYYHWLILWNGGLPGQRSQKGRHGKTKFSTIFFKGTTEAKTSTARGGGGGFKNRHPIGKFGCC